VNKPGRGAKKICHRDLPSPSPTKKMGGKPQLGIGRKNGRKTNGNPVAGKKGLGTAGRKKAAKFFHDNGPCARTKCKKGNLPGGKFEAEQA